MRLAQVDTAFVMTVHKSQGSEFEHTALVLPPGGAEVLSRELVYTGITRAREQFTLVEAEAGLLEAAIHRPSVRASGLSRWWV
jgi:exodeoxyribonuclease V alpha subunit